MALGGKEQLKRALKEKLTGFYTLVSVPETNLVFVHVKQYQKDGNVKYCGLLTDTCRDVSEPSTQARPNPTFPSEPTLHFNPTLSSRFP